jgi:hypothetical protein
MGIGDGSDTIERRSGHTTERQRSRRSKTNERAQARRTQEPRTHAHAVASERWPAALRLPRFSPNSCPTNMQLFNYFSDFKNYIMISNINFSWGMGVFYFINIIYLFISNTSCI